jgi:hypothetical protein
MGVAAMTILAGWAGLSVGFVLGALWVWAVGRAGRAAARGPRGAGRALGRRPLRRVRVRGAGAPEAAPS